MNTQPMTEAPGMFPGVWAAHLWSTASIDGVIHVRGLRASDCRRAAAVMSAFVPSMPVSQSGVIAFSSRTH